MNQNQLSLLGTFQREVMPDLDNQFRCINDTVLIRKIEQTGDIASSQGIVLPVHVTDRMTFGVIAATGNRVPDHYAKGLMVHYNPNAKLEVHIDGKPYLCMSYKDILLFVHPEFERPANEIYIPAGNNILVMWMPKGMETTQGGLIAPNSEAKHNHTGMISALGVNVTEFEIGNFILFKSFVDNHTMLKDFGTAKDFALFDKDFVIGVLYGDSYVWDKSLNWDEKERERRLREVARKQGLLLDGKLV